MAKYEYTEEQTIVQIKKATKDMATLYRQPCLNWSGVTSDTQKRYSEVIAEYLLEFNRWEIKQITRKKTYNVIHNGLKEGEKKTCREEEWLAKSMYNKEYDDIGKIVNYQIPLKDTQADKAGKIDMLATPDKDTLHIIELKKEDNNETLLRCTLEIYTYSKVVNQKKLLHDFGFHEESRVIPLIAIFKGGEQHKQLEALPNVRQLMKKLGVKAVILSNTVKVEEILTP